ncbi:MAG: phenylalanine--tRNA ligase subunit alpha [Candidatus Omnitrophica bacterium]|nr:phenylalanine--tRNA ligase subunit alpha [Candidatus Omnitrophota bacterium]MBU2044238.1 phenylalanine--tRNA ligase subunit alpha [Candidatus Omnitrophota bacterium]MBU2251266.1 phenylalanine--tRNA ligase subunit alpha [Candidatus Omnitrophota bacterium]MBU2265688.1 phenylalanine--tRNA ligase subunit alpha [Candidatus Omnitrophota bacterium]MBU2473445.1 phenylalanine--tRNA ligase subunit alpha [Candidatus Omnitrophota bacterium]
MEQELKKLKEDFERDLAEAKSGTELETLKVKYLGRNSRLAELFSQIPALSGDQRSFWGRRLNQVKKDLAAAWEKATGSTDGQQESLDVTFPSSAVNSGSRHIISSTSQKICLIFQKLGFDIVEGNEIEDEQHNFEALNIPLEHPSRDAFDTFYLNLAEKNNGKYLLRSHTSPSQIRVMQKNKPPLAVISPGRVYRPDVVDATHSFMFHQIEGFAVDTEINFSQLKGVLLCFAREFFSQDVNLRFRPHFFPFTEPSAEVDVSCIICKGQGSKTKTQGKRCSVCKGKGWLEILGCGMIHPKVLEACAIDSKKYRGFAFGMGVERIAMLKYGIDDIRLFYENDLRFLEQFSL